MDLASTVKPSDFDETTVQVFECEPCDIIEIEHPAVMPPIEAVVEGALIDGTSRRSRLVYGIFAPAAISKPDLVI
ncbi:MAG: hypothetical protein ACRD4I_13065 [Candidatus Angelobacter sp.]